MTVVEKAAVSRRAMRAASVLGVGLALLGGCRGLDAAPRPTATSSSDSMRSAVLAACDQALPAYLSPAGDPTQAPIDATHVTLVARCTGWPEHSPSASNPDAWTLERSTGDVGELLSDLADPQSIDEGAYCPSVKRPVQIYVVVDTSGATVAPNLATTSGCWPQFYPTDDSVTQAHFAPL